MNENKNKVINYAQDFGALIALILLCLLYTSDAADEL